MRQNKRIKDWHYPATINIVAAIALACLFANARFVHAGIFRCTDDNGHVVFTQEPCAPSQQSEKVNLDKLDKDPKPSAKVCKQIEKLANLVFPHINDTDSILDIYSELGGRKYLSAGTTAVVNYVFNFRYNPKARQSNVAGLSYDKCLDGGFGYIRERDLPDWDRVKYKMEKNTEKPKLSKQEQQTKEIQCKNYNDKIKQLQDQMDNAKDKNKVLQARVDLEYYRSQKRQHCEAKPNP